MKVQSLKDHLTKAELQVKKNQTHNNQPSKQSSNLTGSPQRNTINSSNLMRAHHMRAFENIDIEPIQVTSTLRNAFQESPRLAKKWNKRGALANSVTGAQDITLTNRVNNPMVKRSIDIVSPTNSLMLRNEAMVQAKLVTSSNL